MLIKNSKKSTLIVLGVVSIILLAASCIHNNKLNYKKNRDLLAKGFVNPSDTIQTSVYWYWMSDNISKEGDDFRLVFVKEGEGEMNVTLSSQPQIERYPEKTLAKMFQRPLPMFNDYLWEKQPEVPEALCVNPKKVIDVTGFVKEGILTWNAPEGDWVISRMSTLTTGVTNGPASPESTGLENYGHWGFPGEFLQYGGQSDEIGGEFWSEGSLGDIENRAATSCGHIYGKTKNSDELWGDGDGKSKN